MAVYGLQFGVQDRVPGQQVVARDDKELAGKDLGVAAAWELAGAVCRRIRQRAVVKQGLLAFPDPRDAPKGGYERLGCRRVLPAGGGRSRRHDDGPDAISTLSQADRGPARPVPDELAHASVRLAGTGSMTACRHHP